MISDLLKFGVLYCYIGPVMALCFVAPFLWKGIESFIIVADLRRRAKIALLWGIVGLSIVLTVIQVLYPVA